MCSEGRGILVALLAAAVVAGCSDSPTSGSQTLDLTGRYRVSEEITSHWTNCNGVRIRGTDSTVSVAQSGSNLSVRVISTESTLRVNSETTQGTVDGDFVRINHTLHFDSQAGVARIVSGASGSVDNASNFNLFGDGVADFGSCEVEFDYTERWRRL